MGQISTMQNNRPKCPNWHAGKSRHYVVILEPPKGDDDSEAVQRLRRWLKQAGRCYGLRCVSAREVENTASREERT